MRRYLALKNIITLSLTVIFILIPSLQFAQVLVTDSMLLRLKSDYGEVAQNRGLALKKLLDELKSRPIDTQLKEVNRFFNQFHYIADMEQWGSKDYWATPEEFLGVNKGDCEDFVIAKYFTLRELGVADEHLYLTYVKAKKQNIAHMVLSYFKTPKSIPLILDNYNPMILPAGKRKDLLPVYSFNAKSLFLSNASAGLGRSLPTDKIKNSKWQKLLSSFNKIRP